MRLGLILVLGTLAWALPVGAQDTPTVRIVHRFDWRRWVDQQYQGLVHGYLTGSWKLTPSAVQPGWNDVEARYYQASESRRDNVLVEKAVEAERTARFHLDPRGRMSGFEGDGVPFYRNFPAPLPADAGPGSVWQDTGEMVGDFLGTGTTTRIPILIEYRWQGSGTYGGQEVVQVATQFAIRYGRDRDDQGDKTLVAGEGTHQGVVSYQPGNHQPVFLRETTKELWTSQGGPKVRNEGFVLTFFEDVAALGTATVAQTLQKAVQAQPQVTPDVKVEADPRGVKLTLQNLRFVADQAVLLPGEDRRLASVTDLLKTVPGRNLLVVGHTAAVGTVESQDSLSVDRALAVVEKLKAAGIPGSHILYEGRGGRQPVASNDTEEGRAQNRRVEIIILDQ